MACIRRVFIQFGPMHHWHAKDPRKSGSRVRSDRPDTILLDLNHLVTSLHLRRMHTCQNTKTSCRPMMLFLRMSIPLGIPSGCSCLGYYFLFHAVTALTGTYFVHVTQRQTQDNPIYGLQFLTPLLQDMTRLKGNRRPTMEEIVARYDGILDMQTSWSLRSRVVYEGDKPPSIQRRIHHWGKQISFILQGLSALPTPQ
jgi:hypothetical protein